jgi:hypothetical protein
MAVSATELVARCSQRVFCLLAALTLSFLCAVAAAGGSVHAMAGMAGMDEASAHLVMTAAEPMSLTPDVAAAIGAVSGDERSLMGSTFEGRCTSNTAADMCTIVAALTVPTLLGLLLGRRRNTFLGFMPRSPLSTQRRRWRDCWRHRAPSLNDLCVLRV